MTAGELVSITETVSSSWLATNAPGNQRAQWQLEGEATWHDSGTSLHALPAQGYTVHFKPVSNWWEPPPRRVSVGANRQIQVDARYCLANGSTGNLPTPMDFGKDIHQSYQSGLPYACAGQLLSAVGWASGFVVQERVVLTAAHAVFDDTALSFVPEVKWLNKELSWFPLVPENDVPRSGVKKAELVYTVAGKERKARVFIVSSPDRLTVLSAVCSHLGCLVNYRKEAREFVCPCHGGKYDITGKNIAGPPPIPLTSYPVEVRNGMVMVGVKYEAAASGT